jgi:hypothetical protein
MCFISIEEEGDEAKLDTQSSSSSMKRRRGEEIDRAPAHQIMKRASDHKKCGPPSASSTGTELKLGDWPY